MHSRCKCGPDARRSGDEHGQQGEVRGRDADREDLQELVEYFGQGNRSAYLRATLKVMRSVKIAEELRDLQAYGQTKLAEAGHTLDDVAGLVRQSPGSRPTG